MGVFIFFITLFLHLIIPFFKLLVLMSLTITMSSDELKFLRDEIEKKYDSEYSNNGPLKKKTYLGGYTKLKKAIENNLKEVEDDRDLGVSEGLLRKLYYDSVIQFRLSFLDACYLYITNNEYKTRDEYLQAFGDKVFEQKEISNEKQVYPSINRVTRLSLIILGTAIIIASAIILSSFFLLRNQNQYESKLHGGNDPNIWSGFVKDYHAYNDSWLVEEITDNEDDLIKIHKNRYSDPDCGLFSFLFFIDTTRAEPWAAYKRFIRFQAGVHLNIKVSLNPTPGNDSLFNKKLREAIDSNSNIPIETLDDHIAVIFNKKKIPSHTFFRGYKKSDSGEMEKISIWYIELSSSLEENTKIRKHPEQIFVTNDPEFWELADKLWKNDVIRTERITGLEIFEKYLSIVGN